MTDTRYETILFSTDDTGVATVTLNRPDIHNAFNHTVVRELDHVVGVISDTTSIRAMVLTGAGKSFSAGGDLKWMKSAGSFTDEENQNDALGLSSMLHRLNTCPKPTIARVNGAAFGGGVGLIACCDMAFAVEGAKFALSEVRLGLTPATISPYVVAAVGQRQARRYFTTAERFEAKDASRIGLIHDTGADIEALDTLVKTAIQNILAGAPGAIADSKRLINDVKEREIDEALRAETARRIAARRASQEGREGLTAFLEKRLANWVVR
ncbi:MAG: enoyl-CoA hydratase-related protein [Pseudomonadota bacterium]